MPVPSSNSGLESRLSASPAPTAADSEVVTRLDQPFRPEPRQLPVRTEYSEQPIGKLMPEPDLDAGARNYRPAPTRRRPLIRVLIPICAISILAAIVFGLCAFLIESKSDSFPPPVTDESPQSEMTTGTPTNSETSDLGLSAVTSIDVHAPESPDAAADASDIRQAPDFSAASARSVKVLESFLAAKNLEQRLPLIETKSEPVGLEESVLNQPLPDVIRFAVEMQRSEAIENLIDTYYSVDFDKGNGEINPQTVLVRIRGDAEPKVVAQPFLDLFGGRLADYASTPAPIGAHFQVIASSIAQCYNVHVPNREKKMTVKLMARDNSRPIAEAYFGKHSRIAGMLADDKSGFRYGQAQPCIILLRWNTEEDPEKPFLEAMNISALNWNP